MTFKLFIQALSVVFCGYFTLAVLGESKSYWTAFQTALLFASIWSLGYAVGRKHD